MQFEKNQLIPCDIGRGGGGGEQIEFHDLDNTKFMQECCI